MSDRNQLNVLKYKELKDLGNLCKTNIEEHKIQKLLFEQEIQPINKLEQENINMIQSALNKSYISERDAKKCLNKFEKQTDQLIDKLNNMLKELEEENKNKTISTLEIDSSLPLILISQKEIDILIDWFDSIDNIDKLCKEIPKVIPRGYICINHNMFNFTIEDLKNYIKSNAKKYKLTYRVTENIVKELLQNINQLISYFYFTEDNIMGIDTYRKDNESLQTSTLSFSGDNFKACFKEITGMKYMNKFNTPISNEKDMETVSSVLQLNIYKVIISLMWYLDSIYSNNTVDPIINMNSVSALKEDLEKIII